MNEITNSGKSTDSICTVGTVLGPLFLKDPKLDADVLPMFEAIASLEADRAGKEWPFAKSDEACESLRLMQDALVNGAPTEEMVWEYRRLFVGPNHLPVPPWGSVYTDHDQVVFGQSTLALRAWMRHRGINRLGDEKTPEDHIGLMLLLLSWIAEHRPEVMGEYLQDHLLPWSSHYLNE